MNIAINGNTYTEEELMAALQEHFKVGDLHGNITHIFRECYKRQYETKGIPYNWKMIDQDYRNYLATGEMPECTWHYYGEVVDPNRPNADKEAAE
jgi:hypothetical protein